jgi:hypothetical protein
MKTLRALALGLLCAVGIWVAPSCAGSGTTTTPCAQSCAGCCTKDGVCHPHADGGDLACPAATGANGSATGTSGSATGTTSGTASTTTGTTTSTTTTTGSTTTTSGTTGSSGTGALTCASPAAFNTNNGGSCGTFRWAVKVGTDSAANAISLTPTEVTIADLRAIPAPAGVNNGAGSSSRLNQAENTLYIVRNVTLIKTKLEPDSDYHLPISDSAGLSLEAEIPFPNTCTTRNGVTSPWVCEITHARAAMERVIMPSGSYTTVNQPVTVVGVGFFDQLHGSFGAPPNGIELHPVLAICFGQDCDPYAN